MYPASFRGHSASFTQIREGICQLAGRLKNGRRVLLLGGRRFIKDDHPFFELISIDTQVFINPVSSRFVGYSEVGQKRDCRKLKEDSRQTLPWDYFRVARHSARISGKRWWKCIFVPITGEQ